MEQYINAKEIFLKNRRFDLIFKYIYLKNLYSYSAYTNFFEDCYCEHIRAFNNFHEDEPSDGIPKESKEDFLNSFKQLYENIQLNGFDKTKESIPIDTNYELSDAAHRIAICTYLNLTVPTKTVPTSIYFDHVFFAKQGLLPFYADYGALEYVKLNKHSYIVQLHSAATIQYDNQVESILNKYGFIYYKKEINLTFNGYVNLKKLSYGFDPENQASWLGTADNQFMGAQAHAQSSMGKNPLRAYIFICDELIKVIRAKSEIRDLYNLGNHSVHINDTHEEAIQTAEIFFNQNSLAMLNARPFTHEDPSLDALIDIFKKNTNDQELDLDDICASGSTPLAVLGIRHSNDLDFLYCGNSPFTPFDPKISNHDSELIYYPYNKVEMIKNPKYHFYYRGIKFISLDILYQMKMSRAEKPKDVHDCKSIKKFKKNLYTPKKKLVIFNKERIGPKRKITICNITFTYTKRKHKNTTQ